jgi:AbrB family looped-hinge helix DNA binding protein
MSAVRAKVSESGRLSLPSDIRRAVGLERGGDVVVELDGHEIRIRTVAEVIARAQKLTKKLLGDRDGTSVDDFLAARREEAERE